jgi:hypothetical protein
VNKETVPSLKSDMTEEQLNVRERALLILLQEFGNEKSNRAIYACAEEWCNKQVNTNGLVSYYKAYYNQHGQT